MKGSTMSAAIYEHTREFGKNILGMNKQTQFQPFPFSLGKWILEI